jgi:hypothetical protein
MPSEIGFHIPRADGVDDDGSATQFLRQLDRKHVHAIWHALREAKDFEDFRKRALDEIRDKEIANMIIRDTRRAIEQSTDEFSNNEELTK